MTARPVLLPARLSEVEKRAIRRNLNALPEIRATVAKPLDRAETVTDVIRRWELGADLLHGAPRRNVDFDALYKQLGGR